MTAPMFPKQATIKDGDTFDYIVAGAGSAGCVVANRLTENSNVRVLLIEAGGDPPVESVFPGLLTFLPDSPVEWNYTTKTDNHTTKCHVNEVHRAIRGKMLGGSGGINYMFYLRGGYEDNESWVNITNDESWSYNNVLKYYEKSERMEDQDILNSETGKFHGTDGYMKVTRQPDAKLIPFLQAFKEVGYKVVLDLNGNNSLGMSPITFTMSEGVRQSTAQSFLSTILGRKNLYVLKNTLVTKILFDKHKNAIGVKIMDEHKNEIKVMAKSEVIVSGGTINSPQILMLSGIGPKKYLQQLQIPVISDLPVGLNLQDHFYVNLFHIMDKVNISSSHLDPKKFPLAAFVGLASLNERKVREYQTFNVISEAESAMQMCGFFFTFNQSICQKLYDESKGRRLLITNLYQVAPKSTGRISLQSRDPTKSPLIYFKPYSHDDDLYNTVKYVRDILRIENSTLLKSTDTKLYQPDCVKGLPVGSDEYWRAYCLCMGSSGFHYTGTCAMGSVVDSRLRVLGVQKLRVVDGSAFPTIPSANTNAAIIMLAEKAADMIKEDQKI